MAEGDETIEAAGEPKDRHLVFTLHQEIKKYATKKGTVKRWTWLGEKKLTNPDVHVIVYGTGFFYSALFLLLACRNALGL